MDFRKWQAEYNTGLDDIKVREVQPLLDQSYARVLSARVWGYLVSQQKIGYGVFKVEQPDVSDCEARTYINFNGAPRWRV